MLRRLISLCLVVIFSTQFFSYPSLALSERDVHSNDNNFSLSAVYTNESNKMIQKIDFSNVDRQIMQLSNNIYSESCECIFRIDESSNISIVDAVPPVSRTTQENSDQTVYWKASLKITYTLRGDTVKLTKVEGSWYQLRGTSSITYREVTYGQVYLVTNSKSGDKFPTGNSFSYNTGFSAGRIVNNKSYIGAYSCIKYEHIGLESRLELFCDKNF